MFSRMDKFMLLFFRAHSQIVIFSKTNVSIFRVRQALLSVFIFFLALCSESPGAYAQGVNEQVLIIPRPVAMTQLNEYFELPPHVTLSVTPSAGLEGIVAQLKEKLSATGKSVSVINTAAANIQLHILTEPNEQLGTEGYHLRVDHKHILLEANKPAGLFYGLQTLYQLFPPKIESPQVDDTINWRVQGADITDYPRFGWRGLMFDVARHFFTKEEVKRYIDQMVKYKFNILHLHLSDDEGWRIEIKSYPRLTQVGAWSVKKEGYFGTFTPPAPNEPRNYGGFYTQEDIKELVQYAAARFVNILPEIDVPGHSLAAVAAYPELSGTPDAVNYKVRSGERIVDWSKPGGPRALIDNTLSPANEKVYEFLDKVIGELAELFPFDYIHMGGDECTKNFWEQNDAIKALAKANNLKNMDEVQSYFEHRVEQIVLSKGKKFMGWDEILQGGLAPSAAVMSWRGMKGGIEAARQQHEVVMTPSTHAYLDYMQGDVAIEPRVYASLRLSQAYQFDPQPDSVDVKYIKGGQGNLWTENIYNLRHAEYMTWPRGMAIAESVWSPRGTKNWNNFFGRVEQHFKRLEEAGVKYAPSAYDPAFSTNVIADKKLQITLTTEAPGLTLYYSFDNSFPDQFYPKYTQPLIAPRDAVMLKVISYKGNKPVGRMISYPIKDLQARIRYQ